MPINAKVCLRTTAVLFVLMVAGIAPASTHYIAANGSDSNNGTSKTTPWLHAPGMSNCSATCASYTPVAGDQFIFRGGDTWHFGNSNQNSYVGVANAGYQVGWNWQWSGSAGSCNYPSVTSSCIYIGVDKSWFSGSSFARPIMNLDNPVIANSTSPDSSHPGFVTACPYEDHNYVAVMLRVNYVMFDNFEFFGSCLTAPVTYGAGLFNIYGNYIAIIDSYFHGWTEAYKPGSGIDQTAIIAGNSADQHTVYAYDVFDGSDSTCPGVNACTGGPAFYGDAYDVHGSVFRYMSNALNSPSNVTTVHDNLFEYLYESYDPADHGGIIEMGGVETNNPISIYNNVFRHTNIGITTSFEVASTAYVFNNVYFDIGNSANCMQLVNANPSLSPQTVFLTNNTIDNTSSNSSPGCGIRLLNQGGQVWNGTLNYQNNHFIGYGSPGTLANTYNQAAGTTMSANDRGANIFQSEAAANAQGYLASNNYAPTSSGGATVGQGSNLSSSCSQFSPDSALCSSTTGGANEASNFVAALVSTILNNRPPTSAWDAGAYMFGSNSASQPNPPTSVIATVQ
jgi:hypothetical protein